ncbi:MAG: hypothetical protein GY811_17765 [Myxococcales bacterium]|nr:hypothetical protein [Myxococcales bacterium]
MTCGQSGMCLPCGGSDSCIGGSCSADPAWTITIDSAIISSIDEDGSAWDAFGGPLADAYVAGSLADDIGIRWVTETIDNVTYPNWDEEVASYLQSELIGDGIGFFVLDSDTASWETIGNCVMTITMGDLKEGTKTITCGDLVSALTIDFAPQ